VYSLAASQATAGRGALLSVAYSLGLGVPFVLVALGLARVTRTLNVVRRHIRLVSRLGGALLILIGVLLLTGTWDLWMNELRASFGSIGVGSGL
jgi:cytochrome c-type biogenesis protein